jgi:hypothetical protein
MRYYLLGGALIGGGVLVVTFAIALGIAWLLRHARQG